MKLPHDFTVDLLQKEQTIVEEELKRLRSDIREGLSELEQRQGRDLNAGFNLKGMNRSEFSGSAIP